MEADGRSRGRQRPGPRPEHGRCPPHLYRGRVPHISTEGGTEPSSPARQGKPGRCPRLSSPEHVPPRPWAGPSPLTRGAAASQRRPPATPRGAPPAQPEEATLPDAHRWTLREPVWPPGPPPCRGQGSGGPALQGCRARGPSGRAAATPLAPEASSPHLRSPPSHASPRGTWASVSGARAQLGPLRSDKRARTQSGGGGGPPKGGAGSRGPEGAGS